MKSYSQFESEMSDEDKAVADAMFNSIFEEWKDSPPMWCFSDRASDADHFKLVEIPEFL